MRKVRWVVSYVFCRKFHMLSSSANFLKIGKDLTMFQTVKRWELFSNTVYNVKEKAAPISVSLCNQCRYKSNERIDDDSRTVL